MKSSILLIFLSAIWISLSEFVRNEFLFKSYWIDHYSSMGLVFPSEPLNGAVWGLWSILFAVLVYLIRCRFSFYETIGVSWLAGFILMWVVTGNMGVLPIGILIFAVPLSLLETAGAVWILSRAK